MTDRSTWQLDADQLARLLGIGEDHELPDDEAAVDELTAELLRRRFAGAIPFDPTSATTLNVVLGRTSTSLAETVGEALLDPQTDMAVLLQIKSWGKQLANRERGRPNRAPEYTVGLTVYYAAIAGALVFHDEKITEYSFSDLAASLEKLVGKRWLAPVLGDLFARAVRVCKERSS